MRGIYRFSVLTMCVVLLGAAPLSVARAATPPTELAQAGNIIQQIVVEGAQRIEPDSVKSYLLVREGDAFDAQRIDRSLKSLFATGLFADVTLRRQGPALIVTLVENPIINRLAFEGNDVLDNETLEAEVTLRPRVIYTRTKVQNDVKRLQTLYRRSGRFAVTVEPKVIQLAQNRVDLVFEISEGELTQISSIRFVGNKEFGDGRLREEIRTKESAWFRFLSSDDAYDPDRLTLDRELLRRFYLSEGYADFRVRSAVAELTPDRQDFFITFTVSEGDRYKFGNLGIDAKLRDLKSDALADVVEIEEGDWYDIGEVDKAIDALTDRVGELGYAFVDVRPRVKRDRKTNTININFEVNEGPRVFVERIDITGNVRTLDKVVRREFKLVEGDAFNSAKLRRSRQRIQNLGFFEAVQVQRVPGSAPDKAVLKVDVQEKSTGSIGLSAGFSTAIGPLGEIELREQNFLGRGQDVSLKLSIASSRSRVDFSFTEPYFLDREVSAGFDIFHVAQDLQDFSSIDTERTGFGLRSGYPITEELSQSWGYSFRRSAIDDVADGASSLIKGQTGEEFISEVSHTIQYDTRDSRLQPTKGHFVNFRTDVAGLGGSLNHVRNTIRGAQYFPIADKWILSVGGKAGYVVGLTEDVHFLERYFIGGDDLRGFATSGVGPRDTVTDDALGGEWMYVGSVEVTFPVGLPSEFGVSGRLFTDFGSSGQIEPSNGNVGDTGSVRVSVGTGATWTSPFGPIGLDLGFPVVDEEFDVDELFRVNFGARF